MRLLQQPQILVVDPDPVSLTAISAILNCHNFQIQGASDRLAALRAIDQFQLDLILCDERIDPPGQPMLIELLQQHPEKFDVPVMYMSVHQMPDVIHRPHGIGAAYHLRKPIDSRVLVSLVEKALWQLPLINHHVREPYFRQRSGAVVAPAAAVAAVAVPLPETASV